MKKYILRYMILFLIVGFIPSVVSASSVYLETSRNNVSVGDTFIVSVKIDAEDASINSVEGDIVFENNNNNLVVNDFTLSKSILSLWPRTPSLSTDGSTISFVGGVPGGFDLDKAILFNIIIEANKEGAVKISPNNLAVYINDGKGTRSLAEISGLTVNVLPKDDKVAPINEWTGLVANDKISPEKFDIVIGREASLFEGRRFAFFTAVDNQSGISYYEVSEDGKLPIRSGSMYVLDNQDEKVTPDLVVTAYDKAGNKTISVYKKTGTLIFGFPLSFFIIILIIIIIWILFRKVKRNKKNVQQNQQI